MEEITRHYLISGRVQGVGFRAFTHRQAVQLKLRGWVRNLDDGRVEAVAQGAKAALVEFEAKLRSGPPHGKVESVKIEDVNAKISDDFVVLTDGAEPWSKN